MSGRSIILNGFRASGEPTLQLVADWLRCATEESMLCCDWSVLRAVELIRVFSVTFLTSVSPLFGHVETSSISLSFRLSVFLLTVESDSLVLLLASWYFGFRAELVITLTLFNYKVVVFLREFSLATWS